MARRYSAGVLLRRQRKPLHHAHEEAEGAGARAPKPDPTRGSTGTEARTDPISAPAALGGESRAARDFPASLAQKAPLRVRVPRGKLASGRSVRIAASAQCSVLHL